MLLKKWIQKENDFFFALFLFVEKVEKAFKIYTINEAL